MQQQLRVRIKQTLGECFLWERPFRQRVMQIMLPVLLQQLLAFSIGIVDSLMVTGMGDAAYAAVVQANRLTSLYQHVIVGIQSAAFIFLNQYWGAGDIKRLRQIMGLTLLVSGMVALLVMAVVLAFPGPLLSIFLGPGESLEYAKEYLSIVVWSFLPYALNGAYTVATRASGITWTAMTASMVSMGVNLLLNYLLIGGHWGFPALGVRGAALATVTAMLASTALTIFLPYRLRLASGAQPREWLGAEKALVSRYIRMLGPFILQDLVWSLGSSMYGIYYGRMGDAAVATVSVASTLSGVFSIITAGLNQAANIMVGTELGRGQVQKAYVTGKRLLAMITAASLTLGLVLVLFRKPMLGLFTGLSSEVRDGAMVLVIVTSMCYVLRILPSVLLGGILRSGGDTHFSFVTTCWTMWLVAVPVTGLAALVLHLPLPAVLLCTYLDEIIKIILGLRKFVSLKWASVLTGRPVAKT